MCKKGSCFAKTHERLYLVPNCEDRGFTAYDAGDVNFRLEDGLAMFMTEEDVLEPGWHRWKYNELRGDKKWVRWSTSELVYETKIIGWKKARRWPGIVALGAGATASDRNGPSEVVGAGSQAALGEQVCGGKGVHCFWGTRTSGGGKKRKSSSAGGGPTWRACDGCRRR